MTSAMLWIQFDKTRLPTRNDTFWDDPAQLEEKLISDAGQVFYLDQKIPHPYPCKVRSPLDTHRDWVNSPVQIEVFPTRNFDPTMYRWLSQYDWNANYWYGGHSPLFTGNGAAQTLWIASGTDYHACPDDTFHPDCPLDQCDNEALFSSDLIRIVRKVTGQAPVQTDSSKFEGYCQTLLQSTLGDQDKLNAWWKSAWVTSPGRATLVGLNSKSTPVFPPDNSNTSPDNTTAIVLGVIGAVVAVSLLVFCIIRRSKRPSETTPLLRDQHHDPS
jgi:hypothetical protein